MHRRLLSKFFLLSRPPYQTNSFLSRSTAVLIPTSSDFTPRSSKLTRRTSTMLQSDSPSAPKQPFIVRFYGPEQAEDDKGRTLGEILNFNDRALEYHHNFIQVLFPLPERSPINPSAALITRADREAFLQDPALRDQLFKAFTRLANFYAFDVSGNKDDPTLTPKANFQRLASETWLTRMDHNHLRISRIVRSLRILGLQKVADSFLDVLKQNSGNRVSSRSIMYWERAATRPLHLPPSEDDEGAEGISWLREEA